jgi:hypothetical protein
VSVPKAGSAPRKPATPAPRAAVRPASRPAAPGRAPAASQFLPARLRTSAPAVARPRLRQDLLLQRVSRGHRPERPPATPSTSEASTTTASRPASSHPRPSSSTFRSPRVSKGVPRPHQPRNQKRPAPQEPGALLSPGILRAAYTSVNRICEHDFAMPRPHRFRLPVLAPDRLVQLDPEGTDEAWALQREYMAWRPLPPASTAGSRPGMN